MEAGTEQRQDQEQSSDEKQNVGTVEQITGVVIEAVFADELPEINHALHIRKTDAMREEEEEDIAGTADEFLTLEVQQHLGDDRVRAVAMDSTDGLQRGAEVIDTGGPISVPVGRGTLGRLFNLLGDPIDNGGDVDYEERWPIHRDAPGVTDLTPTTEMLETGIKVVDL